MLNKFFLLFHSKDSYHKSNISVISVANRLFVTILGAIYYKSTYWISSITKNKALDPKQTKPTPNSADSSNISGNKSEAIKEDSESTSTSNESSSTASSTDESSSTASSTDESSSTASSTDESSSTASNKEESESTECKVKVIKESISDRTSKNEDVHPLLFSTNKASHPGEDELQKLFPEPSASKKFPEDYANELHVFHTMQFQHPSTYYQTWDTQTSQKLIEKLQKPITSPSQLIQMKQKYLSFESFNNIYYAQKIKVENDQTQSSDRPDTKRAYSDLNAQLSNQPAVGHTMNYTLKLKAALKQPACLTNLILMFGLEYSVIAHMAFRGGPDVFSWRTTERIIRCPDLNSAKNFYYLYRKKPSLIKIPLIHLAVEKNILPKVSFLLTADNVNCKSYQGAYLNNTQILDQEITLLILDTPLKIAIDQYDDVAVKILLEHQANLNMPIRPNLSYCGGSEYGRFVIRVRKVESFTKLSDYFLTKTPEKGHETTSYIKIADLLYRSLPPGEEKNNFLNKAAEKKLTIYSESTGTTKDEVLLNLLAPRTPSKSARNVGHEETKKKMPEPLQENKIEEPAATELDSTTPAQHQLPSSGDLTLPDIQQEEKRKHVGESRAAFNNITLDMSSPYYTNTTLPNTTGSTSYDYDSHVNLAGYQAFSALTHPHSTIEYHEL